MKVWKTAAWLSVYVVVFGTFAVVASQNCHGRGLMAALTFVECALVSAVAAVLCVELDPQELGVAGFVRRLALDCGLVLAASSAVLTAAWGFAGAEPLLGGLGAQIVILAFALLLGAVFALVRCSGSELLFAQLVSIFVACALMGTVFYADPLVEARQSPESRGTVIAAVLSTNPLTAFSWSLLKFDLLRRQLMYDRISVIGRWYRTTYPAWWTTVCGYVVVSAVMLAGAGLLRRHRTLSLIRQGGQG